MVFWGILGRSLRAGSRLPQGVHDGVKRGFGPAVAVEEQGVIDTSPGEVVEPALAVVEVPEGDAFDDVGMPSEESEQPGILLGLAIEKIWREPLAVGVQARQFLAVAAAVCPPAGAGDHIDVEFGEDGFEAEGAEGVEGAFELFEGDLVDFVMALEADGVDGDVLFAETPEEAKAFFALGRQFVVVVVVDEEGLGIGLVGPTEAPSDEFVVAEAGPPGGSEPVVAVVEGLVDHIPLGDAAAVTSDDGVDVVAQALKEELPIGRGVPGRVEPGRGAIVLGPDEAVADDLESVAFGESHECVRGGEAPLVFPRLDGGRFEGVFGSHDPKVAQEQGVVLGALGEGVVDTDAEAKPGPGHHGEGRLGGVMCGGTVHPVPRACREEGAEEGKTAKAEPAKRPKEEREGRRFHPWMMSSMFSGRCRETSLTTSPRKSWARVRRVRAPRMSMSTPRVAARSRMVAAGWSLTA